MDLKIENHFGPVIIGIDPGWADLGFAIIGAPTNKDNALRLAFSKTYTPRDYASNYDFIQEAFSGIPLSVTVLGVHIERFVSYNGIRLNPEDILMLIGAIQYYCNSAGLTVYMHRAIDWKSSLCKYLVRTSKGGFKNPYTSFDKRYSSFAAKWITGKDFPTDHEADAVCLASMEMLDK